MKTQIFYITCIFLLLCNTAFSESDPSLRTIFWLHGFGGDNTSWQRYYEQGGPFTNNFPASHFAPTYYTLSGVEEAAFEAETAMLFEGTTNEDFAICHSMGGLTIRQIEVNQGLNTIHGYITVGSPNDGAYLAHSFLAGDVDEFFISGCKEVFEDPISAAFPYWTNPLNVIINGEFGYDFTCEDLYQSLKDGGLNAFTSQQTVTDLAPNSDVINSLNAYQSELSRIAIYGNENNPVHWRLFQSFLPHFSPSELPLDVTKDDALPKANIFLIANYLSLAHLTDIFFVVTLPVPHIHMPANNPENNPFSVLGGELRQGARWLYWSGSEWGSLICRSMSPPQVDQWQSFIYKGPGSSQNQQQSYQEVSDDAIIYDVFVAGGVQNCALNEGDWWPYQLHEVTQFGMCESDGVVERNSATTLPNPTEAYYIEIPGANHQQLVNHPAMTTQLNNIMVIGAYDQFFKVVN